MDRCVAWLESVLADGAMNCEEVKELARKAGFTRKELRDARAKLDVISSSITIWSLPEEAS